MGPLPPRAWALAEVLALLLPGWKGSGHWLNVFYEMETYLAPAPGVCVVGSVRGSRQHLRPVRPPRRTGRGLGAFSGMLYGL